MSTPPAPDPNNPRRAAFGQPLSQPNSSAQAAPQPRKRNQSNDEDESVGETLLDEIDDTFDISGKALGCAWWMIRLPFRIIWKLIDAATDLF